MSRSSGDLPDRLLDDGATDFERRVLSAASHRQPSAEMSRRMAAALGVSASLGAATVAKGLLAQAAASKAAGSGSAALLPWLLATVFGLGAAGLIGSYAWRARAPQERPPFIAASAPRTVSPNAIEVVPTPAAATAPEASSKAARAPVSISTLRDEIALIDDARAAVSAHADRRALAFVRQYEDKYPRGAFLPEATVLKVEVLVRLGRIAEAREIAKRFLAENGGTMLADRVTQAIASTPP
jgi:hypothetical protein